MREVLQEQLEGVVFIRLDVYLDALGRYLQSRKGVEKDMFEELFLSCLRYFSDAETKRGKHDFSHLSPLRVSINLGLFKICLVSQDERMAFSTRELVKFPYGDPNLIYVYVHIQYTQGPVHNYITAGP
jgi:hypothetical protein